MAIFGILALIFGLTVLILWRLHRGRLHRIIGEDFKNLSNVFRQPPPSIFLMAILFLGLLPAVVGAQAAPPAISISPTTYYQDEEIFYLSGTAEANSLIKLVFTGEDGKEALNVDVKSDKMGDWSMARELSLIPGKWQVKAGIAQGNSYLWSEPKAFNAVLAGSLLGVMGVSYAQTSIFLLAIIVLSLLFLAYFFLRVRGKINNNTINLQN